MSRDGPVRPRGYALLKTLAWIVTNVFLRRVDVTGASRIAEGEPTVIAANHTNGLADPIVLAAKLPGLPRFLAASYLWKLPPARLLFWLAEVVPIYRRRDGANTAENASMFSACHDALAQGAHLALFPEGEVHREPAMLPLKTGAARIALGAAAEDGTLGITIVPVGLVYDDKGRFRSQAAIHVGKPIAIDDWVERYRADGPGTVRAVTDLLTDRLREITLNHASWHEATVIDRAAAITALGDRSDEPREPAFSERSALHRALAAAIASHGGEDGEAFQRLAVAVEAHRRDLALLGVDNPRAVPHLQPGRIRLRLARLATGSMILLPFATVGMVLNGGIIPAVHLVRTFVKHPAWQATAKGLTGFVLLPVMWGTETTVAYRRLGGRAALVVAASGPIGGMAWIAWRARWLRWRRTAASLEWFRHPDAALAAARASRQDVIDQVGALVGEPMAARARMLV
jgi:glycerol-3-phosphate O-acyltransferase/dihydroxyacetone phosphate acyltransferase